MNLVPRLEPEPGSAPPQAGAAPPQAAGQASRWDLRRRLDRARDLLMAEPPAAYDGWLAAREARGMRERTLLLRRVAALGALVQTAPEGVVESEVDRLVADVERHRRRTRALQWDAVQLELGGSD